MVAPSLHCVGDIDGTVSIGCVGQGLTADSRHSMASGGSPIDGGRKPKFSFKFAKVSARVESEGDSPVERRFSARIQKLKSEKASCVNRLEEAPKSRSEQCSRKKEKGYKRKKENTPAGSEELAGEADVLIVGSSDAVANCSMENGKSKNAESTDVVDNGTVNVVTTANGVEKSASAKVKETLRTFNKYYLHFVQVGIWKTFFFLIECL